MVPSSAVVVPSSARRGTNANRVDTVTGLFKGEVAQVRIWSSPCSEASLQCLVGRSGAFEADATLVCLWKADEGCGAVLRNSRPLNPPKPPRGAKAGSWCGETGAEGHAELVGEWAWVPCFDPDDYDSEGGSPTAAGAGVGAPYSSSSVAAVASGGVQNQSPPVGRDEGQSAAKRGSAEVAVAMAASTSTEADTDLARSLGWRSVSTAGDEEDEEDGVASSSDHGKGRNGEAKGQGTSVSCCADNAGAATAATAATAAGASAALGAYAAIGWASGDGAVGREVSAREALLGVLGKLFQQCSVYLVPCHGDPLVEITAYPQGSRTQAMVQLQLIRREERALKTVVQPEVRAHVVVCLCGAWIVLDRSGCSDCLLLYQQERIEFFLYRNMLPASDPRAFFSLTRLCRQKLVACRCTCTMV